MLLNETTDVANLAKLCVYVCYLHERNLEVEFFKETVSHLKIAWRPLRNFLKSLKTTDLT